MRPSVLLIAAFVCLTSTIAVALAHMGKDMPRPFLQRHALMGSLAAHTKAIKAAIGAKDMKLAASQAEAIHWLARVLPDTFPKGSGPAMGMTRAAPKIWADWNGFTKASNRLAETASALQKKATADDLKASEAAFKAMTVQGCGGCHKVYRTAKR